MMQPNGGNIYRLGLVDLTADEQAMEGEIVQLVVAESVLHCSPEAPPLTPQNEQGIVIHNCDVVEACTFIVGVWKLLLVCCTA